MKPRHDPDDETIPDELLRKNRPLDREAYEVWWERRLAWFVSRGLGKLPAHQPDRDGR